MKKKIPHKSTHVSARVMERIHAENISIGSEGVEAFSKFFIGAAIAFCFIFGVFFTSIAFHKLSIPKVFGVSFVLSHFPWFSTGLGIAMFLLTFALIEKYKIFYRWTLTKLTIALILLFVGVGFAIHKTPFHDRLMASRFSGIYLVEGKPLSIFAGRVTQKRTDKNFVFETVTGDTMKVYLSPKVFGSTQVSEGESLVITGHWDAQMLVADGVLNLGSRKLKSQK